jgi:hypothetical protein
MSSGSPSKAAAAAQASPAKAGGTPTKTGGTPEKAHAHIKPEVQHEQVGSARAGASRRPYIGHRRSPPARSS